MTFIYALIDPRNNQIQYIGKSNNPEKRFEQHLSESKRNFTTRRCKWLRKISSLGLSPTLKIIEECDNWEERERYWIKYYRDLGFDLVNGTDGGDTGPTLIGENSPNFGKPKGIDQRKKISISKSGKQIKKKNGSSKYFGVSRFQKYWRVRIFRFKKEISIGLFKDELDAARAYNRYVIDNRLDYKINII